MPRGKNGSVLVTPPADQPYLMIIRPVEDTPGLEPVVVDVETGAADHGADERVPRECAHR